MKVQAGFQLMTYRFVVYALTYCSTLSHDNFGMEKIIRLQQLIFMGFTVGSTSQYGDAPYHIECKGYLS